MQDTLALRTKKEGTSTVAYSQDNHKGDLVELIEVLVHRTPLMADLGDMKDSHERLVWATIFRFEWVVRLGASVEMKQNDVVAAEDVSSKDCVADSKLEFGSVKLAHGELEMALRERITFWVAQELRQKWVDVNRLQM